jgi:hypothetical protein
MAMGAKSCDGHGRIRKAGDPISDGDQKRLALAKDHGCNGQQKWH